MGPNFMFSVPKRVRLAGSAAVTNKLVSFFCAPSALSRTSCFNSIHCLSPFAFFVARSICNDTRLLWGCKEILSSYFFSSFLYHFVIFQSLFNFIRRSGRKEILPVDNLSVSPVALFLPFVTILPPIGKSYSSETYKIDLQARKVRPKEGRKIAQVQVSEQRHKSSVNLSGESWMSSVDNLDVLGKK